MLIGTTFFVLIETSITKGFRTALMMNTGVFLSDITYICLIALGSTPFITTVTNNHVFRLVSAVFFILFGMLYIFVKHKTKTNVLVKDKSFLNLFLQGYFVNLFNPSVLIIWTGILFYAVSNMGYKESGLAVYMTVIVIVVIITDITKIYFARYLKKLLNNKVLTLINIGVGIFLTLFGVKILLETFQAL